LGRRKIESDDDRYLVQRDGNYYYKRRVPTNVAKLDERGPHVRISLKTADRKVARKKRDQLEAADNALWASMIVDGVTDPARRRYEAAVKQVEAMGFMFTSSAGLADLSRKFDDLRRRLYEVEAGLERNHTLSMAVVGAIDVPKTTINDAFDLYCDEIVADELITKSQAQRDQWKKVKKRAVNNFIELVADKAMEDIAVDDARKVYQHWLGRIAPKEGRPTASYSSGNRDLGNLRVLYDAYFRHMGQTHRANPFSGFSFSAKKKRSRPPIPVDWIRDKILAKAESLEGLNDEARGILLMIIETGARPSEIANLSPTSFRLSHKVPHVSIEPREDPDDPREIKTESSRRLVPLVGVALAAAQRHHKLGFPRYRDRENDLSATLNKFLRANDLMPTKGHTVYSFRHSFEDRMKEGGLEDELRRLLMGHTVDRPKYGEGGSLEWRQRELLKIALPFDAAIVGRAPEPLQ
jgi:integrase